MNCRILQGDVFAKLPEIEPGSMDCCVTSPPYWMLRSYLPKGHPLKALELGQEPTARQYVANCVRWCGLVRDCLADHGTLWLNVGDTYSATGKSGGSSGGMNARQLEGAEGLRSWNPASDVPAGNLCLIPQRLMIALQDDGWIVRSVIVWRKPSAMPASITGWLWRRCRGKVKGHKNDSEWGRTGRVYDAALGGQRYAGTQWEDCPGCKKCAPNGGLVLRRGSWRPTSSYEPVIMLAKAANYFCDGESVKTPPKTSTVERDRYSRILDDPDEQCAVDHDHETACVDWANLRDVWDIPHEPLRDEKHYAAYPSELPSRCIKAATSEHGYCTACGKPFVRVVEHERTLQSGSGRSGNAIVGKNGERLQGGGDTGDIRRGPVVSTRTTGWRPSCKCPDAKPRPGRVLDPFCGSGRTAIAARRLGLDFTGVELNSDFVAMGKRLAKADMPLFTEVEEDGTEAA